MYTFVYMCSNVSSSQRHGLVRGLTVIVAFCTCKMQWWDVMEELSESMISLEYQTVWIWVQTVRKGYQ